MQQCTEGSPGLHAMDAAQPEANKARRQRASAPFVSFMVATLPPPRWAPRGAGSHVLTLRFDTGHVRLSKLGGTYALRELQLYSLGTNTLYHRLNPSPDVRFPAVRVKELVAPEVTPAIETMMRSGEFNLHE
jgi:hypothetical protein